MLPQLSRHEISLASVIHLLQCGLASRNSVYLNKVQLVQRGPLWPASPLESSINKDSFDPAAHPLAVLRDPLQRADATVFVNTKQHRPLQNHSHMTAVLRDILCLELLY